MVPRQSAWLRCYTRCFRNSKMQNEVGHKGKAELAAIPRSINALIYKIKMASFLLNQGAKNI